MGANIRWSSSTAKVYENCLFRFYCKITEQEKDEDVDNSYGDAGTVVHDTLEYYYKNSLDLPFQEALIELENYFNVLWEAANILNPVIKKDLYWLCVVNGVKLEIKATDLEYKFAIEEDNLKYLGYADVMNTKEHWIGDWKTSTYKKSKIDGYKEQLQFYSWAYWKKFKIVPTSWVYFNKVNKIFKFKFTEEELQSVEAHLLKIDEEVAQRLKTLDFPRSSSRTNCYFCPYKGVCSGDLLRKDTAEKYEITFHLKKNKLLIEGAIPVIIHRKIEKNINFEVKNAQFIIKAMAARGVKYDGIKRLYRRKEYGAETFIGYQLQIYKELKEFAHSQGKIIRLTIKDYRNKEILENNINTKDKLNVPFKLYKFQLDAVEALLKHRWGIIEIGTGGGKTVIAAEAIRRLNLRTLFVIDNKDLLLQTKKEYEEMLGVKCGIVGLGYKEWNNPIVLATIQTLAKHVKLFADELAKFPCLVLDECLGGSTRILTEEGIKKIKDIVDNKYKGKVLSYNLENKIYEWKKILAHYKTEKRKHGYRIFLKGNTKPLKTTAEHKLYTTRGYVKAQDLEVTDILLKQKTKWSLIAKEGRKGANNPQFTNSNREHGGRIFNNRKGKYKYKYKHQEVFCIYHKIEYVDNTFCIHHLDHDATNNDIKNLLLMSETEHKKYHCNRGKEVDITQLKIAKALQPYRIKQLRNLKPKIHQEELIPIEIEKIEISQTHAGINYYDIEIEDNHNFFANGILSHNCHIIASKSYETLSKYLINTKYRFCFSATPRRDDGNDNVIYAHGGTVIYKRNAQQLIEDGVLVEPKAIFYKYESEQFISDTWQNEYEDGIVDNDSRNNLIKSIAEKYLKEGKQVMILTKMIRHGEWFKENVKGADLIYGKTADKIRVSVLDDFKAGKLHCLVGNLKIFNKGINIKNLDVIINAAGNAGEVVTVQTIGRALRKNFGKKECFYIDFMDKGEYLRKHSLSRIESLKDQSYNVEIVDKFAN